jgi:hypothetical protein
LLQHLKLQNAPSLHSPSKFVHGESREHSTN